MILNLYPILIYVPMKSELGPAPCFGTCKINADPIFCDHSDEHHNQFQWKIELEKNSNKSGCGIAMQLSVCICVSIATTKSGMIQNRVPKKVIYFIWQFSRAPLRARYWKYVLPRSFITFFTSNQSKIKWHHEQYHTKTRLKEQNLFLLKWYYSFREN